MTDEKDMELTPDEKPAADDSGVDQAADTPDASAEESQAEASASEVAVEASGEAPAGEAPAEEAPAGEASANDPDKVVNEDDASEGDAEEAMLAMLEKLPDEGGAAKAEDIDFGAAKVADAEFQQLTQPAGNAEPSNIELLMDVDLPVAIELGRTNMTINEILALGPGSVVELNKLAGEPVDLLVNSKVVARGEVVVVDENFGLRVTHLLTPEERLQTLAQE